MLGVAELRHFLIFISFLGLQGGASSVRNSATGDLKCLSQGSRSFCNVLLKVDAFHLAGSFVVENKLVKSQVLEVALLAVASNSFALLLIELQSGVLFMESLHNHGSEDSELAPQSLFEFSFNVNVISPVLDVIIVNVRTFRSVLSPWTLLPFDLGRLRNTWV